MKLKFYIDESGNTQSPFFVVGGFCYFYENDKTSPFYDSKEVLNFHYRQKMIIHIGKLIFDLRKTIENKIKQGDITYDAKWLNSFLNRKEVKGRDLTDEEKMSFFSKMPKYGQRIVWNICNNESWDKHKRNANDNNLNWRFNFLLKILLAKFISRNWAEIEKKFASDMIEIEINIGMRGFTKSEYYADLESYLNDEIVKEILLQGVPAHRVHYIVIKVKYLNSNKDYQIQYADLIANLIFLYNKSYFDKADISFIEKIYGRMIENLFHYGYDYYMPPRIRGWFT